MPSIKRGFFEKEDLKTILNKWESKLKEVEIYGKYSLKPREESLRKRLRGYIEYTKELLNSEKELKKFLEELNTGNYKFSTFRVFYVANPYFGKMRLTLNIPVKLDNRKIPKEFKDLLALKLLANKLKDEYFSDVEYNVRQKIIKSLVKKLNNLEKDYYLIRGDFKNYTLNIPRNTLLKLLKEKIEEENILQLINNYLSTKNQISAKFFNLGDLEEFLEGHYRGQFLSDADFKAISGVDGIIPGSPLSNILGWIFLHKFDNKVKELIGKEGFYSRFLDDFIIIAPKNKSKHLKDDLIYFLKKHYGFEKEFTKVDKDIVKFEITKPLSQIEEFDFLGYLFRFENSNLKQISIRYKTIKKFLYKYLYEYSFEKYKSKHRKENCLKVFKDYLISKAVYLNQWILSFIYVNDKILLDELYLKFILPNLYKEIKNIRKSCKEFEVNFENLAKSIRNLYKLTLIHRQLIKGLTKNDFNKFLQNRFKTIENKINDVL